MATYGRKRHVLSVPPTPGSPGRSANYKRPKPKIHGPLASTIYSGDMRVQASLRRRDSIDELADILLEDTVMDDCHYNQAMGVYICDDNTVSGTHTAKYSAHLENRCTAKAQRGFSRRYGTSMKPVEEAQPDNKRVEKTSPINAIKAGSFSTVQQDISQTRSFTPNWDNANVKMQAVVTTAKDFEPDTSYFLLPEAYTPADYCHWATGKVLAGEVKLDYQQVERLKLTNSGGNIGSPLDRHDILQPYPLAFNAVDLNSKIEAMMAATKALKPNLSEPLNPGVHLPLANNSHPKDGKVLTKMKTAMNHHFQTRTNKKSSEPDKSLSKKEALPQSALTTMEIRVNEGDNLTNPKIISLTGHGKIRRKPLPDDAKLSISQSSSTYRLAQSKSEPILELSSDTHCSTCEPLEADATEPFPTYDTDYDVPFSSSPIAQSTPRICVQHAFEDRIATMKLTCADPRSFSNLRASNFHDKYSDIDLDFNGNETSSVVQRRPPKPKGSRPSARSINGSRMKKHPSPSKAELEKWDQIICDFPPTKSSGSGSQVYDNGVNVYLHPNSTTGLKSNYTGLQESTRKYYKVEGVEKLKLQVPDVTRTTPAMEEAYNRNKGRKLFVSKHRNSKTKSREGSRGGRPHHSNVAIEDDIMETDELQWDRPALMRKVA